MSFSVCVSDIAECPVTDLWILPVNTTDSKIADPDYMSLLDSSGQLYLSYTGLTNDRSNSPL